MLEVRIQLEDKVLRAFIRRNQAYASNTHIFIVWMVGTSLVLLMIAIPFLRNQIRPILKLAEAAESFGKGRPMPPDFRPRGAEEVRRAGFAFIQMRERIERQIEQRTAMLTGVSHDLRTILTRFKLQLALSGSKPDIEALNRDIDDMQSMLEGYLEFARGEAAEDPGRFDLAGYFEKLANEAKLRKRTLTTTLTGDPTIHVRPNAFARLLANVIGNSLRYARNVRVEAIHTRGSLTVIIDDDGPGIPAESREDVFKPFVRLDEARNLDASGTGPGPCHRPRHRPQPRRRHHAGRQPDGRPARHRARSGLIRIVTRLRHRRGAAQYRGGARPITLPILSRRTLSREGASERAYAGALGGNMLEKTSNKKLSEFLDRFGGALASRDIEAAASLFQDDCYWRDLVTFTWNIRTLEGKDDDPRHAEKPARRHQAFGLGDRGGRGCRRGRRLAGRLDHLRDQGGARLRPHKAEERPDLDAAHHHGRAQGS